MLHLASCCTILVILANTGIAQPTRIQVTSPSDSSDTKLNDKAVPEVYAISSQFERVVVVRLKYQTDLLAGIQDMVKRERIKNAVIVAGSGSVLNYHFHVVSNRSFPSKNIFIRDTTSSADIVSMNGYVIDGRVHAHITLSDTDKAFGGHLESGTTVFTFAIVTLGVLKEGTDLKRIDDKTYR